MREEYLTLKEVAQLMRKSKSWVYHQWPSFIEYGVRPIRTPWTQKGRLLFKRSSIENMLEKWAVV